MGNELAGERQGALSLGIRHPHPVRAVVLLLLRPCSWLFSSPAFLEAGQLGLRILVLVNELTSWVGRGGECSLKLLPCASWIGDLPKYHRTDGQLAGCVSVEQGGVAYHCSNLL